jgi:hypothetical protein
MIAFEKNLRKIRIISEIQSLCSSVCKLCFLADKNIIHETCKSIYFYYFCAAKK